MIRQQLWGLMLLAAVAAYLWGSGEPKHLESSRSTGPNVLLITLDTTRADAISAEQTPWVMRMADEGAQFSLAVSTAPITQPAHLGILSGEPPIRSGVVTNGTHIGDRPGMLSHRLKAGTQTVPKSSLNVVSEIALSIVGESLTEVTVI